jgi:hypothetical protein
MRQGEVRPAGKAVQARRVHHSSRSPSFLVDQLSTIRFPASHPVSGRFAIKEQDQWPEAMLTS